MVVAFAAGISNVSAQLLSTIAGNGTAGYAGDGGPALNAQFNVPVAICSDKSGNIFVADHLNQRIRKIDAVTGFISTVAGKGTIGFSGDGGPAINAEMHNPVYLVADNKNHLFFSDYYNLRIRMIDLTTGIITTIAGDSSENYVSGALATKNGLLPYGLAFDNKGDLYVSQRPGPFASNTTNIISKIDMATGIITTYAGSGQVGFAGDGGPALAASFTYPMGMCFDASNNLYVADNINSRVRKIDAVTGIVTTVAGGTGSRIAPEGSLAVNVGLGNPTDVKIDPSGDLIIVDPGDFRIAKVSMSTGVINTIVGRNFYGTGGDCLPALGTPIGEPRVVAFDRNGTLCFTDHSFHLIRSVIPGTVPTISVAPSAPINCLKDSVTFTAITTGTGFQSEYQWKKNGIAVGINSPSYTDVFSKDDQVSCVLTPKTCGNGQITSLPYTVPGNSSVAPSVTVDATSKEICPGAAITFTATNRSGSGDARFDWYLNNTVALTGSASFTSSSLANGDIVRCKMTVNDCNAGIVSVYSGADTVKVNAPQLTTASISALTAQLCKGTIAKFSSSVQNAGYAALYQWKVNGIAAGSDSSIFETAALKDGDVINLTVTTTETLNACLPLQTANSNSIVVKILQPVDPKLTISFPASPICEGEAIKLQAVLTPAVVNPVFSWRLNNNAIQGDSAVTIAHTLPGDIVSCTAALTGCTVASVAAANIALQVNALPVINVSPADTVVTGGATVQLHASIAGTGFTYTWSPTDMLESSGTLTPFTVPLQKPVTFTITAISASGCTSIKKINIIVNTRLYMPAAFTPNGDGRNDIFRIPLSVFIKLDYFTIFDRWGNKLFSTSDITKGWDGTFKGKKLPAGVFVYDIKGSNINGPVSKKGTVVLIR